MHKIIRNIVAGMVVALVLLYAGSIVLSLISGTDNFYGVKSELVNIFGSMPKAMAFQLLTTGILGGVIGGISTIFNSERFSLLKATIIHLLVVGIGAYVVSYMNYWIKHDLITQFFSNIRVIIGSIIPNKEVLYFHPYTFGSLLGYILFFLVVYIVFWIILFLKMRSKINKVNDALRRKNKN